MNQNTIISTFLGAAFLGTGMLLSDPQVSIAQPASASTNSLVPAAYRSVSDRAARQTLSTVEIAPGRTTAIDFSHTNQAIAYVLLGDSSRIVYTANAQLGSAQAKTLFLRQIQQLRFPGATTAPMTTLSVQTIDSTGQQYLYTFNLVLTNRSQYVGLMVVADTPTDQPERLVVSRDRTATLTDVESGLAIAIRKGFTSRQDPVVESVRQFLALARNGSTIKEAANQANVSLSVVTALAEIALDERLVRSLRPVANVTHSEMAKQKEAVAPELKLSIENARPKSTMQVVK
ncbi:hypothetical protein C7B80_02955 [Cyanosarcina cf. burmensis CCALA 770]|nr:hypothetical protein C7B80_02955 [Cyanosarcina cf. burmensis CCALA 770]